MSRYESHQAISGFSGRIQQLRPCQKAMEAVRVSEAELRFDQLDGFCQLLQGQVHLEQGPLFLGALLALSRQHKVMVC